MNMIWKPSRCFPKKSTCPASHWAKGSASRGVRWGGSARIVATAMDANGFGRAVGLDPNLRVFRPTAAYGHFGREEEGFTWERTDKAEALKAAV